MPKSRRPLWTAALLLASGAQAAPFNKDFRLPDSGEGLLAFAPVGMAAPAAGYHLDRLFDAARGRMLSTDLVVSPRRGPAKSSEKAPADAAAAKVPKEYRRTFRILMGRVGEIDRFDPIIVRNAQRHQLDPRLLKAIIAAESEFTETARSPAGALGLMQLMPKTALCMGVAPATLFDPVANIRAGATYMAYLFRTIYKRHGLTGSFARAPGWVVSRVLAAYNAGMRFLKPKPLYRETRHYVAKVLLYHRSAVARIRQPRPSPGSHSLVRP